MKTQTHCARILPARYGDPFEHATARAPAQRVGLSFRPDCALQVDDVTFDFVRIGSRPFHDGKVRIVYVG